MSRKLPPRELERESAREHLNTIAENAASQEIIKAIFRIFSSSTMRRDQRTVLLNEIKQAKRELTETNALQRGTVNIGVPETPSAKRKGLS